MDGIALLGRSGEKAALGREGDIQDAATGFEELLGRRGCGRGGLALFVQRRALRQPVEDADGRRLSLDPVAQPHPDAHEALVRDADDGGVRERHLRRRHEEGHARLAERLDDRRELGGRNVGDLRSSAWRDNASRIRPMES